MLQELKIKDFGIMEQMVFRPSAGLNALTGETGTGKSLVLSAIDAVLGGKCSAGIVRHGAPRAALEAIFDIKEAEAVKNWLREHNLPVKDRYLHLYREIATQGRPRPSINGERVNLNLLRELSNLLVEFHGQHENQRILDADTHLDYLDRFAGTMEQRQEVASLYQSFRKLQERLRVVSLESDERERRLDFLHFALGELDDFELVPGEFDALVQEKQLIENSGHLYQNLSSCYSSLREEENSITDRLEKIVSTLQDQVSFIPGLEDHLNNIQESVYLLEAATDYIRDKREELQFSPERLEDIEERLAIYRSLFKKYGGNTEAVLNTKEKYLRELSSIEMSAEELELLQSELTVIHAQLLEKAEVLSRMRRSVIADLEIRLADELDALGMNGAIIKISVQREVKPAAKNHNQEDKREFVIHESGLDRVEFLLSANTGEGTQPLRKTASGGELSRITLALKTIFFESNSIGLVIFDEVDSGVGGEIAHTIATRLKRLSNRSQMLVVTHLHQLASEADCHFQILKKIADGRTFSIIQELDGEHRLAEMARMLGGKSQDKVVLEHARKLLDRSSAA